MNKGIDNIPNIFKYGISKKKKIKKGTGLRSGRYGSRRGSKGRKQIWFVILKKWVELVIFK